MLRKKFDGEGGITMKNTEKRIEEIRKVLAYIENLKNPDWEAKTEEYYLCKELKELEEECR